MKKIVGILTVYLATNSDLRMLMPGRYKSPSVVLFERTVVKFFNDEHKSFDIIKLEEEMLKYSEIAVLIGMPYVTIEEQSKQLFNEVVRNKNSYFSDVFKKCCIIAVIENRRKDLINNLYASLDKMEM